MKNNRTFLEKLLDGSEVKWIPLGDVADYEQPTKYLVNSTVYNDNYPTPVLTAGKTFILGYTNEDEGIYFASKSPVIIFDDFTTANKWVDFDFKAKSSAMKMITSKNEKFALLKYIYYWLNTLPNNQTDGDHKRQWISNYANKLIPIPPLSVQTEIVKILDALTTLTSELTSELILRQKQYEYYREKLLNIDEMNKVTELGDVGPVRMCKRILKNQTANSGDIPFYKIGTFGKKPDAYISNELFQEYKQKYSYPKKGDILISASGTIGRTVIFDGENSYFQDSNIVWIDNDETLVLNKYLYHFYKIAKWGIAEGGTIQRLYNDNLKKVKISIPPLKEQHRIVSILDKFETLTNSITEGLPLAIEQSQKRYEYYRELLLNFHNP
ncbi:restriction endonuclease subunit S [Haemophilus influenzae]|uniref:Type I restriction enzyme specificity protein n=2 Tax=Haemophilus influenzae TaxID=727 RepID=A0A158T010_HAEIF|nr:restriction endonuclease subunit S [Haemophilus influenzae]KIP34850.1 restriction endonuclease subunit S [Haemophilus influenzae]KIS36454.1 Type I restriction enzyme specificity protein [Haemophilus influenzae]KMZ33842.1 restriction endonuclease subunit S [Haemophilus influenzae]MCK8858739.1 restriction endonuclease subunit S [Haemophilus influenzae]MDO7258195.1 restriction endonuclease subunit S [Haemophilus influenzae]